MASLINYNSQEVQDAQSILKESVNILQNDIQSPLSSDFGPLKELDLFSDGLSKLTSQVESLIESHTAFAEQLAQHDSEMAELESSQESAVSEYVGGSTGGGGYYGGGSSSSSSVTTDDVDDGKAVTNAYLAEIVPQLSYDSKLQALKNILVDNNGSLTELLTDVSKANILVYELKKMLKDSTAKISDTVTDEEKNIQKILLDAMAVSEKNPFAELSDYTFLKGMPYLVQVAKNNNINFSSLILDDKYSNVLMTALSDIYNGNAANVLNTQEITGVKDYLDLIAKSNGVDVQTLLSDTKYVSVIKGGVKSESTRAI